MRGRGQEIDVWGGCSSSQEKISLLREYIGCRGKIVFILQRTYPLIPDLKSLLCKLFRKLIPEEHSHRQRALIMREEWEYQGLDQVNTDHEPLI